VQVYAPDAHHDDWQELVEWQRAVLLMRDVLGRTLAEVAEHSVRAGRL
jgi:hypothetical protein